MAQCKASFSLAVLYPITTVVSKRLLPAYEKIKPRLISQKQAW